MSMDSTPPRLIDPKLTVYAYHLHQNFTSGTTDNSDRLWKWVEEIGEQLDVENLKEFSKELNLNIQREDSGTAASLLKGDGEAIKFSLKSDSTEVSQMCGEVCCFVIHDCYAIDLTFRLGKDWDTFSLCSLEHLNPGGMMLPHKVQSSLGQTLVFFAGVAKDTPIDKIDKTLANQIASALLTSRAGEPPTPASFRTGKLLGGSIFEFENQQYHPQSHIHLLIWLYPESEPIARNHEARGDYYYPLIDLLESRNKIITVWAEVIKCKKELDELRQYLEDNTKKFKELADSQLEGIEGRKERLNNWEQLLLELPTKSINYDKFLGDMFTHRSSIQANVYNYRIALEELKTIAFEEDDLHFLSQFLKKDCTLFQKQIKLDIDVFAPGRELFYNLIEAMRGMVAIDAEKQKIESSREERQRSIDFKIWLTALGTGLTISSISSRMEPRPSQVMFPNRSQNPNQTQPSIVFNLFDLIIYIFFVAGLSGILVRVALRRFYDWKFPRSVES